VPEPLVPPPELPLVPLPLDAPPEELPDVPLLDGEEAPDEPEPLVLPVLEPDVPLLDGEEAPDEPEPLVLPVLEPDVPLLLPLVEPEPEVPDVPDVPEPPLPASELPRVASRLHPVRPSESASTANAVVSVSLREEVFMGGDEVSLVGQ
jgi:hypothetical protein